MKNLKPTAKKEKVSNNTRERKRYSGRKKERDREREKEREREYLVVFLSAEQMVRQMI